MDEERERPRRRGLLTVLAVAAAVAAVPAGVALAGSGDSGRASGIEAPGGSGAFEVQDAPNGGEPPDRGDGDRRDCPKDHQGGGEGQSDGGGQDQDTTEL